MEEYLNKVIEQIRCKKARPLVKIELQDHMEDQREDNIRKGMDRESALQSAVGEMGDAVEVGTALDRIH